ncbi:MAG: type II secretion system inner membrane protein GspF [Deltaproteobacteria bacterium]|nr:type II secretion system inner membrane protein GspF [Deltaproteobacteria bacterium]
MAVYEYTALNKKGKNIKGIIDADSAITARQKLRDRDIFPIDIKESSVRSKDTGRTDSSISSLFGRVKPGEISAMTRQLSILLGAGVTLVAALEALIIQVTNPLQKKILSQIKESVNEGNSLASSLAQYPKQFSQIYINMVRAGEASGSLDLVLERLAEFSENQEALKGRIRAAMAYPIFMSIVAVLVIFFLLTFIVPNITRIFEDMQQTLPLPTVMLIGISDFLKAYWWLLLIGLGSIMIIISRFKKSDKGRQIFDLFKIKAPLIGLINIKLAMARFGRTLGSLLQSGVPLITALQIVRNIVDNVIISDVIDNAIEEVEEGKNLAVPLGRSKWFPPITVQMITVGEQSGEIEKMLHKIADIYEREVESQTMAMTSILEPVMILVMACVAVFIVFSILLPILEMNQMM